MRFTWYRENDEFHVVDHKQGASTKTRSTPVAVVFDPELADQVVKLLTQLNKQYHRGSL